MLPFVSRRTEGLGGKGSASDLGLGPTPSVVLTSRGLCQVEGNVLYNGAYFGQVARLLVRHAYTCDKREYLVTHTTLPLG